MFCFVVWVCFCLHYAVFAQFWFSYLECFDVFHVIYVLWTGWWVSRCVQSFVVLWRCVLVVNYFRVSFSAVCSLSRFWVSVWRLSHAMWCLTLICVCWHYCLVPQFWQRGAKHSFAFFFIFIFRHPDFFIGLLLLPSHTIYSLRQGRIKFHFRWECLQANSLNT